MRVGARIAVAHFMLIGPTREGDMKTIHAPMGSIVAVLLLGGLAAMTAGAAQLDGTIVRMSGAEVIDARCAGRRLVVRQLDSTTVRLTCQAAPGTATATRTRTPSWTPRLPSPTPTATATPACLGDGCRVPSSTAFGIWSPGRFDTCSAALHDSFYVVGPDGKKYPTWHAPEVVDPATGRTCTFGHEHGRDPRGSDLHAWLTAHYAHPAHPGRTGIPFGLANEALDAWVNVSGGGAHRHEDHVGHKIEWQNDVRLLRSNGTATQPLTPLDITCDFLAKIHQGVHSPDAFGMNVHEVVFAARCSDGSELIGTTLGAFAEPNRFQRGCDRSVVVDALTAFDMPSGNGLRSIPDRACALRDWLVPAGQWSANFYEIWGTGNYFRTADGRQIAYFDPGFAVFDPARYFDAAAPNRLRYVIDLCWEVESNGDRARGGACDLATDYGTRQTPIAWDDPTSPFVGAHRETYFSNFSLANAGGPLYWYTDPYGGHASPVPFAGAVRQLVAPIQDQRPTLESQAFGADRYYGGRGVHAPN